MSRADFLATIAESLARAPSAELAGAIDHTLAVMGSTIGADRVALWLFDEAKPQAVRRQVWVGPEAGSEWGFAEVMPLAVAPALIATILAGEVAQIPDSSLAAPPFHLESAAMAEGGVCSSILIPVGERGQTLGYISLVWTRSIGRWSPADVREASTTASLVAQLLVRSRAEERYGTAFNASPLGIALFGSRAELLEANPAFLDMHGATLEQMRAADLTAFTHPVDRDRVLEAFMSLATREVEELDHVVRSRRLDGSEFHCHSWVSALWGADNTPRLTVVISEDVTETHEQTAALQRSEERLRSVLDNAPVAIFRWDADLRLAYASAAMTSLFGVEPDQVRGQGLDQLIVDPVLQADVHSILTSVFERGSSIDTEVTVETPIGSRVLACRYAPECDSDGGVTAVISIIDDVTALRRSQVVLEQQARHDPLTGLANRQFLEAELPRRIDDDEIAAVLYLDIDHFKVVNDSLGHSAGDELLRVVARRIAGAVREGDLIARLGGDEFVVLLAEGADAAGPWNIASRVRRAIAAPCWIGGQQVVVTASIGVARLTDATASADMLLSRADRAMYQAKSRGRDRTEELDEVMGKTEQTLLARRGELRQAIARSELELFYQPEVSLEDRSVVGAEALLRWHHPTQGLITAAGFIGLAEDAGMMRAIGSLVIREACLMARRLQDDRGRAFSTRINLSAQQLDDDDLEMVLDEALQASGARPEGICLEITETAVMRDAHVVLRRLHALRERGFRLAIDDFGTGYSSLSYLKRFPIDVLKIDRSFVDGLGADPHDTAIVTAIVQMAAALGLEVVAEGVETELQRVELVRLDCRRGHGYLFARPMPAADFGDYLEAAPVSR